MTASTHKHTQAHTSTHAHVPTKARTHSHSTQQCIFEKRRNENKTLSARCCLRFLTRLIRSKASFFSRPKRSSSSRSRWLVCSHTGKAQQQVYVCVCVYVRVNTTLRPVYVPIPLNLSLSLSLDLSLSLSLSVGEHSLATRVRTQSRLASSSAADASLSKTARLDARLDLSFCRRMSVSVRSAFDKLLRLLRNRCSRSSYAAFSRASLICRFCARILAECNAPHA